MALKALVIQSAVVPGNYGNIPSAENLIVGAGVQGASTVLGLTSSTGTDVVRVASGDKFEANVIDSVGATLSLGAAGNATTINIGSGTAGDVINIGGTSGANTSINLWGNVLTQGTETVVGTSEFQDDAVFQGDVTFGVQSTTETDTVTFATHTRITSNMTFGGANRTVAMEDADVDTNAHQFVVSGGDGGDYDSISPGNAGGLGIYGGTGGNYPAGTGGDGGSISIQAGHGGAGTTQGDGGDIELLVGRGDSFGSVIVGNSLYNEAYLLFFSLNDVSPDQAGGPGFRIDSSGNMQFCNVGGSWSNFASGTTLPTGVNDGDRLEYVGSSWTVVQDIQLAYEGADRVIDVRDGATARHLTVRAGGTTTAGGDGGSLFLVGGAALGAGTGGGVAVSGADNSTGGAGGPVAVQGGLSTNSVGGQVSLVGGAATGGSGDGGDVLIHGGNSVGGNMGTVYAHGPWTFESNAGGTYAYVDFQCVDDTNSAGGLATGTRFGSGFGMTWLYNSDGYTITQETAPSGSAGGGMTFRGGHGAGVGGGGNAFFKGGNSGTTGVGGTVTMSAGDSAGTGQNGAAFYVTASDGIDGLVGDDGGDGGSGVITMGDGGAGTLPGGAGGDGGSITFNVGSGAAGVAGSGAGGVFNIVLGTGSPKGYVRFGPSVAAAAEDEFQIICNTGDGVAEAGLRYNNDAAKNVWQIRLDGDATWHDILTSASSSTVPAGTNEYDHLYWTGSAWAASEHLYLPDKANIFVNITDGDNSGALTIGGQSSSSSGVDGGSTYVTAGNASGAASAGHVQISGGTNSDAGGSPGNVYINGGSADVGASLGTIYLGYGTTSLVSFGWASSTVNYLFHGHASNRLIAGSDGNTIVMNAASDHVLKVDQAASGAGNDLTIEAGESSGGGTAAGDLYLLGGANGTGGGIVYVGGSQSNIVYLGSGTGGISFVYSTGTLQAADAVNTAIIDLPHTQGVIRATANNFKIGGDAVSNNVTAANLATLTAGPASDASALHTHSSISLTGYTNGAPTYDTGLGVGTATTGSITGGVVVGYGAGAGVTTGSNLTLVGCLAGANTAVGLTDSTAVGYTALRYAQGTSNTAVGFGALSGSSFSGTNNVGVGRYVGTSLTTGSRNVFVGDNAGDSVTTGSDNVAIGYSAASNTITSSTSVAVGAYAAQDSTSAVTAVGYEAARYANGNTSVAVGYRALKGASATSAPGTTVAIGHEAGVAVTTATAAVYIGYRAGYNITTESYNVLIGREAGTLATSAGNTIVGSYSGIDLVTGGYNSACGYKALYNFVSGSYNCALGYNALYGASGDYVANHNIGLGAESGLSLTSGDGNFLAGRGAGYNLTDSMYNVLLGYEVGHELTSACDYNVAIGYQAMYGSTGALEADYDVAIGNSSLYSITSGDHNIAIGYKALFSTTTSSSNVAVGGFALEQVDTGGSTAVGHISQQYALGAAQYNTSVGFQALRGASGLLTGTHNIGIGVSTGLVLESGYDNVLVGDYAGDALTSGNRNVLIGKYAGTSATTFIQNVLIGQGAGYTTNSSYNVAVGDSALYYGTGERNTAVGYQSQRGNTGGVSTGIRNASLGMYSLYLIESGSYNVAVGYSAGYSVTTSGSCVLLGSSAASGLTTGNNVVAIGSGSAAGLVDGAGGIYIGYGVDVGASNASRELVIGYDITGKGSNQTVIGRETAGSETTDTWLRGTTLHVGNEAADVLRLSFETSERGSVGAGPGIRYSGGAAGYMQVSHDGINWGNITTDLVGYTEDSTTYNTALGVAAGTSLPGAGGVTNVCLGAYAGTDSTSANSLVAVGYYALADVTTASSSVGVGTEAGRFATGTGNVFVGHRANYGAGAGLATGTYNVLIGYNAGYNVDTGSNVAVGYNALYNDPSNGSDNVAVGHDALKSLNGAAASGHNVMIGGSAGDTMVNGQRNTMVGGYAYQGAANTGSYNVGMGWGVMAGTSPTTGSENIGIGSNAVREVTSGGANVGIGKNSLYSVSSGAHNIGIGEEAMYSAATVDHCIGIGYQAGKFVATGGNIAIGNGAMAYDPADQFNIAIGYGSMSSMSGDGSYGCVLIGFEAGRYMEFGDNIIAIGDLAYHGAADGDENIAIGLSSLGNDAASTSGSYNIGIGSSTLYDITTGGYNVAVGNLAATNITTGSSNVALGHDALGDATTSSYNVALGRGSLASAVLLVGDSQVAVGYVALSAANGYGTSGTCQYNTAVGYASLSNIYASNNDQANDGNTAVGYEASSRLTFATQRTTSVGYRALYASSSGVSGSTAIGYESLSGAYGDYNTGLGTYSGNTITAGVGNTCIGYNSDAGTNSNYNIAVGYAALATGTSYCGQFFAGTNSTANQCNFGVAAAGSPQITLRAQTISQWSDVRTKMDIETIGDGLAVVNALRPVSYRMRKDATLTEKEDIEFQARKRFGFIAQEVKESLAKAGWEEHGAYDDRSGDSPDQMWALDYVQFIAPLVRAVQELSEKDEKNQARIGRLEARLEALEARLAA